MDSESSTTLPTGTYLTQGGAAVSRCPRYAPTKNKTALLIWPTIFQEGPISPTQNNKKCLDWKRPPESRVGAESAMRHTESAIALEMPL